MRDFRLFWFGETTSQLGSSISGVAFALVAVSTLHASTFMVSLLSAAVWLPWLVIGLPAGAWVDRMRRRPLMIACDAASVVLFLSIPIAYWLGVLTVGQLVVVELLVGVATVFFQTSYGAFLPALVSRQELPAPTPNCRGAPRRWRSPARASAGSSPRRSARSAGSSPMPRVSPCRWFAC